MPTPLHLPASPLPFLPGLVLRSGNPGRASAGDVNILRRQLQVGEFLDLRSQTELLTDTAWDMLLAATNVEPSVASEHYRAGDTISSETITGIGSGSEANIGGRLAGALDVPPEEADDADADADETSPLNGRATSPQASTRSASRVASEEPPHSHPLPEADLNMAPTGARHHRFALLERSSFARGVLGRLPLWKSALAGAYYVVGAETQLRDLVIPEINAGGLPMLYEILLDRAGDRLRAALERIADAAACETPVLFFCKLGKDRTGVLAALLLTALGATEDQIVADYARSGDAHAVALGGIEKMPELKGMDFKAFEASPPEAMRGLFRYAERRYGGMLRYLDHIGFSEEHRRRLQQALLESETRAQ